MSVRSKVIWMDGQFVPYDEANVHVLSHTLHYGLGLFEGIRSYTQDDGRGAVFRLDDHLNRLYDSAKMCRVEVPLSQEEVRAACLETLRRNGLTEGYIRPLVYLGSGAMGLGARGNQVHVAIATWPWGAYLGAEGVQNGISVATSSFSRHSVGSTLQRAKVVGHYVNSILARYEANDNGFDEAILLDAHGLVAEGTGENIFAIKDGAIKTPSVTNILAGITRRTAIEILQHEGYSVDETLFGRDALYVADEIFLTGTAAEITPVRAVDRRTVGAGKPGPISIKMQQIYSDAVRGRVDWMARHLSRYSID
jgi:branched-chain amino acid aminotransferase